MIGNKRKWCSILLAGLVFLLVSSIIDCTAPNATPIQAGIHDSALLMGSLGATSFVVASDAKTEVKNFAQLLQDAGYPVWVCDGTDDQVEIQAAIDALPAAGGKVLLSEGLFTVSGIIFPRSNTTLSGVGTGTIVRLRDAHNANVIIIGAVNVTNVHIRNFTIDGNRINQTAEYQQSPIRLEAAFSTVERMHLINGYTGINFGNSSFSAAINNHIEDMIGDGIGPNVSTNLLITGNLVRGTGGGIDIADISDSVVVGNIVDGLGVSGRTGIDVVGGSTHNVVVANTLVNISWGVRIMDIGGRLPKYNLIQGNVIRSSHHAVQLGGPAGRLSGSGNKISENLIEDAIVGIKVFPGSNFAVFSGNSITNTTHEGILIDGADSPRIIGNNLFSAGILTHNTRDSILVLNSTRPFISGNTLDGGPQVNQPRSGISVDAASSDGHIRDNDLINAGVTPLINDSATTVVINNLGYVTENTGVATFSGTGVATTFKFAHGLASTPTVVNLEARSADATGDKHWSADGTNITVIFITAPLAGTNNIVISWEAKVR